VSATQEVRITADASQEIEEIRSLREEVEALRAELDKALARSPRIQVLREPLTYEARLVRDKSSPRGFRAISPRGNASYVQDLILAETRGDMEARARLDQHAREMRIIAESRESLFHPDVDVQFEQRAVNWTNGQGGYLAPPLWIVEQFAIEPTPERVLSKLAPQFELPIGAQSVNIPAWSQGADVDVTGVGAAVSDQDVLDAPISSAVTTIAGNFNVPMQLLEQSPQGAHLDWVAFTTMESRYGYQLELQLLTGTGTSTPQGSGNNQLVGIFNNSAIPTANQINFTPGTFGPTEISPGTGTTTTGAGATYMFAFLGLAIAKIGQNRLLPPEVWMMTTSRMAWLGSSEDSQNRPLMIADKDGSGVFDLIAIEVQLNDAIPRTSGALGNEERIVCCRPSDWLILESERHTQVMTDAPSGTLMARLQMRRYAAALLRYPTSVAYLYGSGMATGGGF
jgi:HK97 family phage major capsid protein